MDTLVAVQNTFKQGKLDEAYRLAHQIALSNSNSAEAFAWLGQICQAQLNYEEALQHYQKAVELQPDNSAYQYQVANIFMLQDKYKQAETGYRQVYKKREISDAWLPCNLGRALLYQGKTEEAIPFLQEAIDLNDRLAEAYGALGNALTESQRFSEAENFYQKAIESDSRNFVYYHDLGDNFLLDQRYEEAITAYHCSIKLNASYFWSYKNLGNVLSALGRLEEAREAFYSATKLNCNSAETYIDLGNTLSNLGQWEEAVAAYKKVNEIDLDLFDSICEKLGEALMHVPITNPIVPEEKRPSYVNSQNPSNISSSYPRLLMIDMTCMGHSSATGQLKQALFAEWPEDNLLQVYSHSKGEIKIFSEAKTIVDRDKPLNLESVMSACKQFNPELIYYRPVADNHHLHRIACQIIDELDIPVVTHMMDDWPDRMLHQQPQLYQLWDQSLRELLTLSSTCLSICEAMSIGYQKRYGVNFFPIANCICPEDWSQSLFKAQIEKNHKISSQKPFTIRFPGSLADDMTFASISDIAKVVSELQQEFPVVLEIYTHPHWQKKGIEAFSKFPNVKICEPKFAQHYREMLCTADALVIAYNFDEESIRYTKYSIANKLPECLAAGVPILAYGPVTVATIDYIAEAGICQTVTERDLGKLKAAIRELAQNPEYGQNLGKKGQSFAFSHHNADKIRGQLHSILRQTLEQKKPAIKLSSAAFSISSIMGYSRDEHAHIDETDLVFEFFKDHKQASIMIDVGAHFGTALDAFAERGWHVFAFEPDPSNREKLLKRVKDLPNVIVDTRAVGNQILNNVPFFTSHESTGVSTLKPFLASHEHKCLISTTTISSICAEHNIKHIDFLKVDTEGYDLMVLQGIPWEGIKPHVIECEFEDSKTVPLGYTFHDLATFLVGKGYTVLVSEWHPIIRYGIEHDWHRLTMYPCELTDSKSWGNIIAFQDDPSLTQIAQLVSRVVTFSSSKISVLKSNLHQGDILVDRIKHYIVQSESLEKQGKVQETIDVLQQILAFRNNVDNEHLLNSDFQKSYFAEPAVKYLRLLYFYAYIKLGEIFVKRGDMEAAILHYNKALEIRPDSQMVSRALNKCTFHTI